MSNGPYQNSSSKVVALFNGLTYLVQAFSNASLSQCVQISPLSGSPAQFDGSGENNVPMGLTQAGFLTGGTNGSWPSFTVPGSPGGTSNYTFTVSNSGNRQGKIQQNYEQIALPSDWYLNVNFVSYEDTPTGKSVDFNDSFVILTTWTPPLS